MAIGTFGTFTQARLGIYAATKGLTVTGNNISNINTVGYTRQAVDQVSLRNGGADRYQGKYDLRVGNGALIRSISQLRDPYLDIRYRTEASIVGHNEQQLKGLTSIADILDEVGKGANKGDGIVFAQFSNFLSSLQQLNEDAAAQSNDTLTRASADTLTNLFHFYADKLEKLERDTADQLQQEVAALNGVLAGIRDLNSAIRKSEIHGDPGLEMRDERNRLIDKLAEYVKIDVVYTMEDIGAGQQVEKLTISLGNANPDPKSKTDSTVLVDGIYARTFEMPESFPVENTAYDPKYKADPANPDPDNDIKQYKYLKADGTGTNVAADAEQILNSNFDMTLTKLLDAKGREWSNIVSSSTTKLTSDEAKELGAPMKAVYAYTLGGDLKWNDPNANPPQALSSIKINGEDYYIGVIGNVINPANPDAKITADTPRIAPAVAKDPSRLAAFIANELRKNDTYSEYDITNDGATIYFTAKEAGAVGELGKEFRINKDAVIPVDEYPVYDPAKPLIHTDPNDPWKSAVSLPLNAEGNYDPNSGDFYYFDNPKCGLVLYEPADPTKPITSPLTDTNGNLVVLNKDGVPFANQEEIDKATGQRCYWIQVPGDYVPVMGSGPAGAPNLTLENGGTNLTLTPGETADPTVTDPAAAMVQEGREGDPTKFPPSPVEVNPDGTTSLTTYAMRGTNWYATKINVEYSQEVPLDDNDLYGAIQAFREILTEAGEFSTADTVSNIDENAAIKRGIPYYQKSLDLLARVFANAFNEANNGYAVDQNGNYLDEDGDTIELAGAPVNKSGITDTQKQTLEEQALGNYIKASWAGFVKDEDGNDTNVLADEDGNALTVGGMELTTSNVKIGTTVLRLSGAVKAENGKLVDKNGKEVEGKVDFTLAAFDAADDPAAAKAAAVADLNGQALERYLTANNADKMGGNLFSCRGDLDDGEGITASNISVSRSWANGDVHIVNTFTKLFGGDIENTTQDNNIGHMVSLMSKGLVYDPSSLVDGAESTHLFQGSFQDMLINMCSVLGNDQTEVQTNLNTAATYQVEMDTNRDSVSAVDLNDEAMNMMTYAKSLNAAYRLMTTLDEALERLINNTGVVGR